ncbi:hypothetical protein [Bradyrhizobium ganzhouense]|uniref:hypothetical protein n=1 Tax=Bradyrhizobium ganzhouense TaxID=1179767 RepID=UPI003CF0C2A9
MIGAGVYRNGEERQDHEQAAEKTQAPRGHLRAADQKQDQNEPTRNAHHDSIDPFQTDVEHVARRRLHRVNANADIGNTPTSQPRKIYRDCAGRTHSAPVQREVPDVDPQAYQVRRNPSNDVSCASNTKRLLKEFVRDEPRRDDAPGRYGRRPASRSRPIARTARPV